MAYIRGDISEGSYPVAYIWGLISEGLYPGLMSGVFYPGAAGVLYPGV